MEPEYIIVQAGGKGTRMEQLTANKPKALVPVDNLPMLFHLFRKYPDKKFLIIADYKADVMRKYLSAFAKAAYLVIDAQGKKGTCAGIRTALEKLPEKSPFLLIWSDLVLADSVELPEKEGDYIGLSQSFPCRWKYEAQTFAEEQSEKNGVAGWFLFTDKEKLKDIPMEGEFVRWLKEQEKRFVPLNLSDTREYGLLSVYREAQKEQTMRRCRPFNSLTSKDGMLIKSGIDEQGRRLAVIEKEWYRFVQERNFTRIPKIYQLEPDICMERVEGGNIYEYTELSHREKCRILKGLIETLKELHRLGRTETDYFSIWDAYVGKTWDRLGRIRDLVPFADQRTIRINGKECRNVFFYKKELERMFEAYRCKEFVVIHGDNTFSNMMLDKKQEPVLIDPRGYFGKKKLYGDPAYDWAKLYYSIVGNYDAFNQKRFTLDIGGEEVTLQIESSHWEDMEEEFFRLLEGEADRKEIRLIHAVIWLSLTTYAWEDYDSICGAFYNGLYYLEDLLP